MSIFKVSGKAFIANLVNISASELNVTWNEPRDPNGEINGYHLSWTMKRNDRNESVQGHVHGIYQKAVDGQSSSSYTITELSKFLIL